MCLQSRIVDSRSENQPMGQSSSLRALSQDRIVRIEHEQPRVVDRARHYQLHVREPRRRS